MWFLTFVLAVLAAASCAEMIGLDIQRNEPLDFVKNDQARSIRRQVSQTLDNLRSLYFANITLGTPPQNLRLHVDTGSSDLWCNSAQSTLCKTSSDNCEVSGTYDSTSSSTYEFVSDGFDISYMDGTGAVGNYVTDTIGIGGQNITDLQFGVGLRSTSTEGVLGIGYPLNEVQVNRGQGQPYHNLPELMVDDGLINSSAYSLWLNDLDANTGQILFGGINMDKYHGNLQTVPILQVAGQYAELLIALSGISVGGTDLPWPSPSLSTAVLLDSGTTLMYLPTTVAKALYREVQAVTEYSSGGILPYVPCALANLNKTMDFTFSGIRISVPFNELVLPSDRPQRPNLQFVDGTPACVFGVAPSEGTAVLGDTFLRSAYVVYDLANNQISLAQTNFNSTTDAFKEIGVGPDSVPDATLVPNPITTAAGIARGAARLASAGTPVDAVVSSASAHGSTFSWLMAPLLMAILICTRAITA